MKIVINLLSILLITSLSPSLGAIPNQSKHVQAELLTEVDSIQPGTPFWVGVFLQIDPDWHTYWENPGENCLPTTLEWDLPKDFQASDIHWPVPKRFELEGLVSYGYADQVLLLVKITPSQDIETDPELTLNATASWLECNDSCLPRYKAPLPYSSH